MQSTNPKHQLAIAIMNAVAAGSSLSNSDQTALAKQIVLAKLKAEEGPWTTQTGGRRSNS